MATRRSKGGRPTIWTKPKILDALRAATARLGRVPKSEELWRGKIGCPSITVIRRNFGTVRDAMLAAGLEPRKIGGVVRHGWRAKEVILPAIDPVRAAQITEAKRTFWQNGGHLSTWVHPYARRSHGAQPVRASTVPKNQTRRSA